MRRYVRERTDIFRGRTLFVAAVPFLMIAAGFDCDAEKKPPELPDTRNMVARVNDSILSREELDDDLPDFFGDVYSPDEKGEYIEQWIESELLYQRALQEGLQQDEDIQKKISQFQRMLLEQEVLRKYLEGRITVSDEEISHYYTANRESFIRDEDEYRINKIVFQSEKVAREIVGELSVAPEQYDDLIASGAYGGMVAVIDLGFYPNSELPGTFGDQMKDFEIGKVSQKILSAPGSWYVLRAVEFRQKGSMRDLSEVEDRIRNILMQAKSEEAKRLWLEELKREADIVIAPENGG